MKISSQSRAGDYFELELAEGAYTSDEAGALWIDGVVVRYRRQVGPHHVGGVSESARFFELAGVKVRLRVDGFGVGAAVQKALASSGRKAKSGAVQVFVTKEPLPWKEVES